MTNSVIEDLKRRMDQLGQEGGTSALDDLRDRMSSLPNIPVGIESENAGLLPAESPPPPAIELPANEPGGRKAQYYNPGFGYTPSYQNKELKDPMELVTDIAKAFPATFWGTLEMGSRAGETLAPFGASEYFGDWADTFQRKGQPYRVEGGLGGAINQGIQSFGESIALGAPGAAAGGAIGGLPGAFVGFALGAGALFSAAEYSSFLSDVEDAAIAAGATREEIKKIRKSLREEALVSAAAEGGFELAGDLLMGKIFGLIGSGTIKEPVKKSLKATAMKVVGNYLKTSGTETATEMMTAIVQNQMRVRTGIPGLGLGYGPGGKIPADWEAAKQVIGPTLVASVLFTGAGMVSRSRQQKALRNSFHNTFAGSGLTREEIDRVLAQNLTPKQAYQKLRNLAEKVKRPVVETSKQDVLEEEGQRPDEEFAKKFEEEQQRKIDEELRENLKEDEEPVPFTEEDTKDEAGAKRVLNEQPEEALEYALKPTIPSRRDAERLGLELFLHGQEERRKFQDLLKKVIGWTGPGEDSIHLEELPAPEAEAETDDAKKETFVKEPAKKKKPSKFSQRPANEMTIREWVVRQLRGRPLYVNPKEEGEFLDRISKTKRFKNRRERGINLSGHEFSVTAIQEDLEALRVPGLVTGKWKPGKQYTSFKSLMQAFVDDFPGIFPNYGNYQTTDYSDMDDIDNFLNILRGLNLRGQVVHGEQLGNIIGESTFEMTPEEEEEYARNKEEKAAEKEAAFDPEYEFIQNDDGTFDVFKKGVQIPTSFGQHFATWTEAVRAKKQYVEFLDLDDQEELFETGDDFTLFSRHQVAFDREISEQEEKNINETVQFLEKEIGRLQDSRINITKDESKKLRGKVYDKKTGEDISDLPPDKYLEKSLADEVIREKDKLSDAEYRAWQKKLERMQRANDKSIQGILQKIKDFEASLDAINKGQYLVATTLLNRHKVKHNLPYRPVVAWRGTRQGISGPRSFAPYYQSTWWATNRKAAEEWSGGKGGRVSEGRLLIKNPFDPANPDHFKLIRKRFEQVVRRYWDKYNPGEHKNKIREVMDRVQAGREYEFTQSPLVINLIKMLGFDSIFNYERSYDFGVFDPDNVIVPHQYIFESNEDFEDIKPDGKEGYSSTRFVGDTPGPGKRTDSNEPETTVFELPELVELVRMILKGDLPKIKEFLKDGASGMLRRVNGRVGILLRADDFVGPVIREGYVTKEKLEETIDDIKKEILRSTGLTEDTLVVHHSWDRKKKKYRVTFLKKDPNFAPKVLGHEIGHLADYLPDESLKRGNILGRIASLRGYMHKYLATLGGPGLLNKKDYERLEEEAKKFYSEPRYAWVDEEIVKTLGLTPEDVLAIWNSTDFDKNKWPGLYDYVAQLSDAQKKSIVKEALKGQIPEELKQFAQEVREKTGKKIKKKVSGVRTKWGIKKKYEELIREEVKKRQLYELRQIEGELRALTQWWNPFNPEQDKAYTKYRYQSTELYAEALSVLLNNPQALKDKAPEFYRGFFDYLERKPEFKAAYEDIVRQIKAGKDVDNFIARKLEGYERAEAKQAKNYERNKFWDRKTFQAMLRLLQDVSATIKGKSREVERTKGLDPAKNPTYAIDNAVYSGSEQEAYLTRIRDAVVSYMNENGIDWNIFDLYVDMKRVIHERSMMANPGGTTEKRAKETLEKIKHDLGPERFKALEFARKEFWNTRKQFIVQKAKEAGLFSDELMKKIEDNEYYATFEIVKYIDEKHGRGTGVKIYRQIGTFEENMGPATATIMKDVSLIRAINWNTAKKTVVDVMSKEYPGEITAAETYYEDGKKKFRDPTDPDKRLILHMHGGKLQGHYVDQSIHDAFRRENDLATDTAVRIANAFGTPFRTVFTIMRPGFWIFNVQKDFRRAVRNLKGASIILGKQKFLKHYLQAIKPAYRLEFGIPDAVGQEMLKGNMLISVADIGGMTREDTQIERMLAMKGLSRQEWKNKWQAPFINLFHNFMKVGAMLERMPKIAGYTYLHENFPGMSAQEMAHIIRHRVGSPSFITKGRATPVLNNILLYSNAAFQGWISDIEAFRENKGEVAKKVILYSVIPKAIMWSMASGAFYMLLKGLGGDDDDPYMKWAKSTEKMYQNVGEYDMTNYLVIPLGITPQGKTVYIRMPLDETDRIIAGLFYKIMNGDSVIDRILEPITYAGDQVPSLNPAFDTSRAVFSYLSGNNPYDYFRGRYVLSENLNTARNMDAHLTLAKWVWNQLGGGILYQFKTSDPGEINTELEQALIPYLEAPLQPIASTAEAGKWPILGDVVSRFIKVSDLGKREMFEDAIKEIEKQEARDLELRKSAAKKSIEGESLSDEEKEAIEKSKRSYDAQIGNARLKQEGSTYEKELAYSKTKSQRYAKQLEIMKIEGPDFDIKPLIENDIISQSRELSDPFPLTKTKIEERRKQNEGILQWYKERGLSEKDIKKIYQPELNKLQTKARTERLRRLDAQLKKL